MLNYSGVKDRKIHVKQVYSSYITHLNTQIILQKSDFLRVK